MSESKEIAVGDRVRVRALPPYVKTAEPMPMLRPPNVISLGEEGIVINRRPGGFWSVRFSRGTFLMDSQYLAVVDDSGLSNIPGSNEHGVEQPPDSSIRPS